MIDFKLNDDDAFIAHARGFGNDGVPIAAHGIENALEILREVHAFGGREHLKRARFAHAATTAASPTTAAIALIIGIELAAAAAIDGVLDVILQRAAGRRIGDGEIEFAGSWIDLRRRNRRDGAGIRLRRRGRGCAESGADGKSFFGGTGAATGELGAGAGTGDGISGGATLRMMSGLMCILGPGGARLRGASVGI